LRTLIPMAATILLTGGMGYVGSHTCVELLDAGYQVIVVDNLSNSSRSVLTRIWEITARRPEFHEVDPLLAA
jgi:UDP-glucose 4-epimerase